jgi:hypothetical protein
MKLRFWYCREQFAFLDQHRGELRWHISFNMGMISFLLSMVHVVDYLLDAVLLLLFSGDDRKWESAYLEGFIILGWIACSDVANAKLWSWLSLGANFSTFDCQLGGLSSLRPSSMNWEVGCSAPPLLDLGVVEFTLEGECYTSHNPAKVSLSV